MIETMLEGLIYLEGKVVIETTLPTVGKLKFELRPSHSGIAPGEGCRYFCIVDDVELFDRGWRVTFDEAKTDRKFLSFLLFDMLTTLIGVHKSCIEELITWGEKDAPLHLRLRESYECV